MKIRERRFICAKLRIKILIINENMLKQCLILIKAYNMRNNLNVWDLFCNNLIDTPPAIKPIYINYLKKMKLIILITTIIFKIYKSINKL